MRIETLSAYRVALASHLFPSRLASCLQNPDRILCLPTAGETLAKPVTVCLNKFLYCFLTTSLTILLTPLSALASIHRDVNLIKAHSTSPSVNRPLAV
jgi:hypothetical protein